MSTTPIVSPSGSPVASPGSPAVTQSELNLYTLETQYEGTQSSSEDENLDEASMPRIYVKSDEVAGTIAKTFFRDPSKTFAAIDSKNYAVHIIFAHSAIPAITESMPQTLFHLTDRIPVAVLQTGGPEGIGCSFRTGAATDYIQLMTTHLKYTFTHMLGISTDSTPPILKDLHYATSDTVIPPGGAPRYEDVPDRILKFSMKENDDAKKDISYFGLYSYIPSVNPPFFRDNRFDALFQGGISASYLLPRIPYIAGTYMMPNIFLIVGCLRVKKRVPVSKIRTTYRKYFDTHINPSRYSLSLNNAAKTAATAASSSIPKELVKRYFANPTAHIARPTGGPRNYISHQLGLKSRKRAHIRKQLKRTNLTLNARKELMKKLSGFRKTRGVKKN